MASSELFYLMLEICFCDSCKLSLLCRGAARFSIMWRWKPFKMDNTLDQVIVQRFGFWFSLSVTWHNIVLFCFVSFQSLLDQGCISNNVWRNIIMVMWYLSGISGLKLINNPGYHLLVMREMPLTVKCEVSLWLPPVPVSPAYEDVSCWATLLR